MILPTASQKTREKHIVEFIKNNPGTSEYAIIAHFSEDTSKNTIISDIKRLITSKKIIDKFEMRKNSKVHKFYINDEDKYNQIDQMLSEIKKRIVKMNRPVRKIIGLKLMDLDILPHKTKTMFPYVENVSNMLWYLLELVKDTKFSKEDSQILHIRIIELITKIRNQHYNVDNSKEITKQALAYNTNILIQTRDGFKNDICDLKTYESLITLKEDFDTQFLS